MIAHIVQIDNMVVLLLSKPEEKSSDQELLRSEPMFRLKNKNR